MNINDRFRQIFKQLNLNKADVSRKTRIKYTTLDSVLNEKTNNKPSFDTLSAFLLGYRDIDPDWLIHGFGNPLRNMINENAELWKSQIIEFNEDTPQYGTEKKEVQPDTAELLKRIELLEIQMKKNEKEIELIKIKKRKE